MHFLGTDFINKSLGHVTNGFPFYLRWCLVLDSRFNLPKIGRAMTLAMEVGLALSANRDGAGLDGWRGSFPFFYLQPPSSLSSFFLFFFLLLSSYIHRASSLFFFFFFPLLFSYFYRVSDGGGGGGGLSPTRPTAICVPVCKRDVVVEINLAGYKLSGIISPSFANLSLLGWMDLSDNQLTGIIPEALTSLANLKLLNLSHNNLQLRLLWKGLVQIIKTLENQRQKHE
jgi:hypothetical protein